MALTRHIIPVSVLLFGSSHLILSAQPINVFFTGEMIFLLRMIDKGDDSLAIWFSEIVITLLAFDIIIVLSVVRLASRANDSISKNTRITVVLSCQGTYLDGNLAPKGSLAAKASLFSHSEGKSVGAMEKKRGHFRREWLCY